MWYVSFISYIQSFLFFCLFSFIFWQTWKYYFVFCLVPAIVCITFWQNGCEEWTEKRRCIRLKWMRTESFFTIIWSNSMWPLSMWIERMTGAGAGYRMSVFVYEMRCCCCLKTCDSTTCITKSQFNSQHAAAHNWIELTYSMVCHFVSHMKLNGRNEVVRRECARVPIVYSAPVSRTFACGSCELQV